MKSISRRDDGVLELDGKLFCISCNRNLTAREDAHTHAHDFLQYDLSDQIDLIPLKCSTHRLIAASQNPERAGEEGDSDLIDWTIIPQVARMNRNPNLATTGSCSGHDGFPFISVVFRESQARDYYLNQIDIRGFEATRSDYYRMGFFSLNFSKVKVREEWNIFPSEDKENETHKSMQFWKICQSVFAEDCTR